MASEITSINLPLSPNHLQAIGRVCALWASAENVLQHLLWSMIPTPIDHGKAITTHMSNEAVVNTIRTLANQRNASEAFVSTMKTLLQELDELRNLRNQVVHNSWAGEDTEFSKGYKPSARGTYNLNTNYWTANDIEELASDIEMWIISCINFCETTVGWPLSIRIAISERK